MNGINRRSQKVVCIAEIEVINNSGHQIPCRIPEVHSVYTVSDFVLSGIIADAVLPIPIRNSAKPAPGITLMEVPALRCHRTGRVTGWPLVAFLPVDERKTDIADLVRLGQDVREPEDA